MAQQMEMLTAFKGGSDTCQAGKVGASVIGVLKMNKVRSENRLPAEASASESSRSLARSTTGGGR